ncbi:Transcriptional regulator [uncultured Pleomorphomonas sp.]|uniref:Transcriptional regulator n=1 Tax=uncultured Pleomorphomonas sp. TaxID=442121 RepID=A0A212LEV9_9HYPH|nr:LacI family DNA-binding transcriptional regulator [uncultured Pleomorphomonas sp.]SCM76075.1 Transcriptional regulator [uncultured Pleomorphomonas sp.]
MTDRTTPTLASIAARVGVSVNTVSRALRAPNTVRPELRQKIRAAMDELNYVPNRLAGGLSGTRSDVVGVIVTSLHHSEFASLVDTLQAELLSHDLQVMLANTRYDPDEEVRLVRAVLSWRPAAIVIVGIDHPPKAVELLRAAGMPVVEMWDVDGPVIDTAVGIDHRAIGRAQGQHLVERGYRRLAFLGSLRDSDSRAHKRLAGVEEATAAAGLGHVARRTEPLPGNPDLGERLLGELIERQPDVDAVVCNSDVIAYGVLRGLRRLGRDVPGDVGVIGFGDSEASSCLTPALTTVRPDREAIGRLAAAAILSRIDGGEPEIRRADWRLMARETTARQSRIPLPAAAGIPADALGKG